VDEFHGDNTGLVVAEIELESEDVDFEIPDWAGEEVTPDERYYNMNLVTNPFQNW
jgi:CYTH domain-containing protein